MTKKTDIIFDKLYKKDETKLYEALEIMKDLNLTPNMIKRLLITFFIIKGK